MVLSGRVDDRDFSLSVTCFKIYRGSRVGQVHDRKCTILQLFKNLVIYVVIMFDPVNANGLNREFVQTRLY